MPKGAEIKDKFDPTAHEGYLGQNKRGLYLFHDPDGYIFLCDQNGARVEGDKGGRMTFFVVGGGVMILDEDSLKVNFV